MNNTAKIQHETAWSVAQTCLSNTLVCIRCY